MYIIKVQYIDYKYNKLKYLFQRNAQYYFKNSFSY